MAGNHKAQSTFEYIILVAAVVAVVVAFVSAPFFRQSVDKVIDGGIGQLARITEGVDFDIPQQSVDFFTAPATQGSPPEGWEHDGIGCYGQNFVIPFLGVDEDGFPVFSDKHVGNYCFAPDPLAPPEYRGAMRFAHTGQLTVWDGSSWVPFDWNNYYHVFMAYQGQRYGPTWARGCGVGGHSSDFYGYFENVFGRPPSCSELYDHYYGHTNNRLEGLTGDLAQYNGMTLWDASAKKNMLEHSLVPDDPGFIGTPQNPGQFHDRWSRESWVTFYRQAVRFGLRHLLPFTMADIDAAFPPGG